MMRAVVSAPPPGGNPTIRRTGRDGYACALDDPDTIGSAAAPAARCRSFRRGSFIWNLPLRTFARRLAPLLAAAGPRDSNSLTILPRPEAPGPPALPDQTGVPFRRPGGVSFHSFQGDATGVPFVRWVGAAWSLQAGEVGGARARPAG